MTGATITKIRGAPGSGKTHALLNCLEAEVEERGVRPSDVSFLTFSSDDAADITADVRDRDIWDSDDVEVDDAVSTVHSLALSICARRRILNPAGRDDHVSIIQPSTNGQKYKEWAQSEGLHFDDGNQDYDKWDLTDTPRGNQVVTVDQMLCQRRWTLDDIHHLDVDVYLTPSKTKKYVRSWRKYKESENLLEHHDYIETAIERGVAPLSEVLIVDEMQDLSPAEYALYKLWRDDADRVYIAGDINQSIYGFKGAEPRYFGGTEADEVIKKKESYRCPPNVAGVARDVLEVGDVTSARGFTAKKNAHDTEGTVVRFEPTAEQLADFVRETVKSGDTVKILARTNAHAYKLGEMLSDRGVLWTWSSGRDGWSEDLIEIVDCLHTWQRGKATTFADTLLDHVPATEERRERMNNTEAIEGPVDPEGFVTTARQLDAAFNDVSSVTDVVGLLDYSDEIRDRVSAALKGQMDPERRDMVEIGTIHSSKGSEADSVVLCVDYTKSLEDDYWTDSDFRRQEHQLYYVGASRASDTLCVVSDLVGSSICPIFADGMPGSEYGVTVSDGTEVVA